MKTNVEARGGPEDGGMIEAIAIKSGTGWKWPGKMWTKSGYCYVLCLNSDGKPSHWTYAPAENRR